MASEAPELMGRISEVVNKAERRLSWRNLLKGELLDETRGAIIKAKTAADYKQRTGNDFEDLSEFEQATERVFGNSRIITPPRDYMERLLEAYTQTADRYAVEFGFSDESKELDED